jgi:muconolactone D-isomerase
MEFLVQISIDLPADLEPAERLSLSHAERERGQELVQNGSIVRIWRVGDPSAMDSGHLENVGLWDASDECELRSLLSKLPFFPWMTVRVTPLRAHPLERG